ncbi:MAG: UDP-2,4-diacetamido-2,4,6-trideoxy-beta-L-altropyranose hydrolase [Proteobacteria bacterium]|nr:UDP-2,4-diacetamido-2,4,6-trideoxy-beta-L-altropyranose hydrolase [Pseudomonadota bacterium]
MRVLFRCDGGPDLGMGHLVRCSALALALVRQGATLTFVTTSGEPALSFLARQGGEVIAANGIRAGSEQDVAWTRDQAVGAGGLVVDHYAWSGDALARLATSTDAAIVIIDDLATRDLSAARLILNQNLLEAGGAYAELDPDRLLLGPGYALLRPDFAAPKTRRASAATPWRVLITMGGADKLGGTEWALRGLSAVKEEVEITVILGGANRRRATIEALTGTYPRPLRIRVGLNASEMAAEMDRADLAVSAAGSTVWELCRLGLPVAAVMTADNQRFAAGTLEHLGAGKSLGRLSDTPPEVVAETVNRWLDAPEVLSRMSRRGRDAVDGRGAERVARRIIETRR